MGDADAERPQGSDRGTRSRDGSSPEQAHSGRGADLQQRCPRCSRLLSVSARHCESCGEALPDDPILVDVTEEQARGVRAVSLRPGKTRALRVFMLLVGGLALAATAAMVFEISRFNTWWAAPAGDDAAEATVLASAEGVSAVAIILLAVAEIILVVLLIIWMYAASKDLRRHDVIRRKWRPAWAIGAWFLPLAGGLVLFIVGLFVELHLAWLLLLVVLVIAAWYIIRSVLNEIDRASGADRSQQRSGLWRFNGILIEGRVWWISFILGGLLGNGGSNAADEQLNAVGAFDSSAYVFALWLSAAGFLVGGLGSLVGSRYIARMGGRFT